MAYQKWQQKNINAGLCKDCGKPRKHNSTVYCPSCAKKSSNRSAKRKEEKRKEWKTAGLCYECGKKKETGKLRCNRCHERLLEYNNRTRKEREAYRKSKNLCYSCGNKKVHKEHDLCEECLLKQYSRDATKTNKHWDYLMSVLVKQNNRCAYTGEKIILGVNASIDHIIPKSSINYPGDDCLENLCWTTRKVNMIKNDMTKEELISFCEAVLTHMAGAGRSSELLDARCCNAGG